MSHRPSQPPSRTGGSSRASSQRRESAARDVSTSGRPSRGVSRAHGSGHGGGGGGYGSEKLVVSNAAIQAGAERVFVTHPRFFSFSQRSLASLRHPYLPSALQQAEADGNKAKRNWQTKAERLTDFLTEGQPQYRFEDERWRSVAFMLDSVLFEADISQRRQTAIEAPAVRRALELMWCKAGGSTARGIGEQEYRRFHRHMYSILLELDDPVLEPVLARAVDAEWVTDAQGDATVSFGRFYTSMLEVADNWLPHCDGDKYAAFLAEMCRKLYPVEEIPAAEREAQREAARVAAAAREQERWGETVTSLQRMAVAHANDIPVISARKGLRGTAVYSRLGDV